MASAVPNCDICQLVRNKSNPAVTWCSECEESFCENCNEHHNAAKATRTHKTITISDYQSLPSSAFDIKHYCEDHDDKFEFYCPTHAAVCCVKCIEVTHNGCRDIKSLRDAIKDIKSSAVVVEYESDLSEVLDIYKRVKEEKVKNLRDIDQQSSQLKEDIRKLRRQVDSHLDVIEKHVMSSLDSNQSSCKEKISQLTSLLDDKTTQIESTIDTINKYKQHASELQTFWGIKEIEKTIEEEKEFIRSMSSRPNSVNFEMKLKVSPAFESFSTRVTSLGSIVVEEKDSLEQISLKSDKHAQIQQHSKTPEIDDIDNVTLTKIVDFNIMKNVAGDIRITGCQILDNMKILLANYSGEEILMFTEQGKFDKKFELSFNPYDICSLNYQKIAISSIVAQCVYIYDMESRKIVNQTSAAMAALGLSFYDGKIYCRVSSVGIKVFSLTLEPISEIKIASSSTTHISVSSGRIYYAETKTKSIVCCDMNGKATVSFGVGISSSRNGCVFVANKNRNKVTLISKDGKKLRTVLKDGLNSPYCVHFQHKTNQLLVCNEDDGSVFMYNINFL